MPADVATDRYSSKCLEIIDGSPFLPKKEALQKYSSQRDVKTMTLYFIMIINVIFKHLSHNTEAVYSENGNKQNINEKLG